MSKVNLSCFGFICLSVSYLRAANHYKKVFILACVVRKFMDIYMSIKKYSIVN